MTCQGPGCRKSLKGRTSRARFCSDRCRTRAWKVARGVEVGLGRSWRENGGERGLGGLQVSYPKAVRAAAELLIWLRPSLGLERAEEYADIWLSEALPARQRQRLENR